MIISCINCIKKFDIDPILIPKSGRLLQCSGCNHKWFFKKNMEDKAEQPIKIDNTEEDINPAITKVSIDDDNLVEFESSETIELLDKKIKSNILIEENSINDETKLNKEKYPETEYKKNKKNYNIFGLSLVFLISFVAFILVVDTFKEPIGKIFPGVEFILYNLYESIKDIMLFAEDLI